MVLGSIKQYSVFITVILFIVTLYTYNISTQGERARERKKVKRREEEKVRETEELNSVALHP